MFFGYKRKGHTFRKSEDDVSKPKLQSSIPTLQVPQSEPLKPIVAVLVEEFRNVQSELAERYEQAAKDLLKNKELKDFAYDNGHYIVIHLQTSLLIKHFEGINLRNEEHLNQLKLAFFNLKIEATAINDSERRRHLVYPRKESHQIVLNIRVKKPTYLFS